MPEGQDDDPIYLAASLTDGTEIPFISSKAASYNFRWAPFSVDGTKQRQGSVNSYQNFTVFKLFRLYISTFCSALQPGLLLIRKTFWFLHANKWFFEPYASCDDTKSWLNQQSWVWDTQFSLLSMTYEMHQVCQCCNDWAKECRVFSQE